MSDFTKHLIIYNTENQSAANHLSESLQLLGHQAMILEKTDTEFADQLGQVTVPDDSAVILLVTDNFLKSYGCMNGVLQASHKWGDSLQLTIVVTDGVVEDEEEKKILVPTNFERVGEIIQYMNFWQDRYLDLRKEKRKRKNDKDLDEQILITKEISGDVGEFLRYLKGYGYLDLESFKEKMAAQQEAGIPEGASILPSPAMEDDQQPPLPDEKSLVEMIEDSSEALIAENAELTFDPATEKEDHDHVTDEILSAIPGLDLLDEKTDDEDTDNSSIFKDLIGDEENTSGATPGKETEAIPNGHFTQQELEKLDGENEELMSILDEVLVDEGLNDSDGNEDYQFVGEDPDNPDDFNIESLFEDDEQLATTQPGADEEAAALVGEDEVLLNLVAEEEDLTSDEILEGAVEYFRENQNEEGIAFLAKALEANPADTSLRYYHAYALARYAGRYDEAEKQLDTLLAQDENHPDGWFLLAELAESKEDFAKAKSCFEKVTKVNPNFPEVQYRIGLLISEQFSGQEEKAAQHLKSAIDQNEKNVDALYQLAILLNEHLNQPKAAVDYFLKALNLQPAHPFTNYDLALVYHGLGDLEKAAEFYEKAVAINPELKTPQNDQAFNTHQQEVEITEDNSGHPTIETMEETASSSTTDSFAAGEPNLADDPAPELMEEVKAAEAKDEKAATEDTVEIPDHKEKHSSETIVTFADENTSAIKTKIVMITGATSGIGKATAELFARNGYRLIMTGRRAERLHDLQEEFVKKYEVNCKTLAFDVRDLPSVREKLENLSGEWKDIDILINNAGLSRGMDPIHAGNLEDWETMIDTNVKGLLYMTRAICPHMVERRSGHIINVSSIAGTEVYPGGNVYCASKAAVSSLTRSMRLDLHKYNIRVSQVAPGHVEETEFARVRFDGDAERAAQVYDNFQPLRSSDVAETIYFIATRPAHVNIQDIYMFGTQQASATMVDRSGR